MVARNNGELKIPQTTLSAHCSGGLPTVAGCSDSKSILANSLDFLLSLVFLTFFGLSYFI